MKLLSSSVFCGWVPNGNSVTKSTCRAGGRCKPTDFESESQPLNLVYLGFLLYVGIHSLPTSILHSSSLAFMDCVDHDWFLLMYADEQASSGCLSSVIENSQDFCLTEFLCGKLNYTIHMLSIQCQGCESGNPISVLHLHVWWPRTVLECSVSMCNFYPLKEHSVEDGCCWLVPVVFFLVWLLSSHAGFWCDYDQCSFYFCWTVLLVHILHVPPLLFNAWLRFF